MTSHDELSYYLSQGLAIRVDGITISDANLEHLNLILNEDDSYMTRHTYPPILLSRCMSTIRKERSTP